MARTIAKDHDDKRRLILDKAAGVFAREGYGASMSQLAKACGISKANIYHYYDSKQLLLFDMMDTHLSELRDRILALKFESDDPKEQLRDIIVELLLAYEGTDAAHDVKWTVMQHLPREMQEILRDHQRKMVAYVRERIVKLAPPSVRDDKTKLRSATMSVFSLTNWYYKWDTKAGPKERKAYAELITSLIVGGLPAIK